MVGGVYMKKYCFPVLSVLMLLGAAACNKQADVDATEPEEAPEPGKTLVWEVSVPASKGGDAATKALAFDSGNMKVLTSFETTDKVYVYNKTRASLDALCLSPDTDGASVNLQGSLQGEYAVGDVLELRYCPYSPFGGGIFDYEEQTGTFETLRDFGVATVSVTAVDEVNRKLTLENAHFTNPYSIFRFTFVDAETSAPIPIQFLWIKTVMGNLVFKDSPDGTREYYGEMADGKIPREVFRSNSTDPVWLSLCYEAPSVSPETDWMAFAILDDVNKIVYDMSKMTDGKITNGKFYTPTIAMVPLPKPEVTLTGSASPVEPTQISTGLYKLFSDNYYYYENPGLEITISGDGDQCRFRWKDSALEPEGATVRFSGTSYGMPQGFTTTQTAFIEHLHRGPLTLVLDGQTKIWGAAEHPAILVDKMYGEVVFKGNGTLILDHVTNSIGTQGIMTADGAGTPSVGVPLNVHAASGYSLSVSGVDNGDGTSTWTYVVAANSGTSIPGIPTFPNAGDPFNS